jgi:hypothetical protein
MKTALLIGLLLTAAAGIFLLAKRASTSTAKPALVTNVTPAAQSYDAATTGITADDWDSWSTQQSARLAADPTAEGWFDDNNGKGEVYETQAQHLANSGAASAAASQAAASATATRVSQITALNAQWNKTPMSADERAGWATSTPPYPMPLNYPASGQQLQDYAASIANAQQDLVPMSTALGGLETSLLNVAGSALGAGPVGTYVNKTLTA